MAYKKCPICELNYIKEEDEMCGVCLKQKENAKEKESKKNFYDAIDKDYHAEHLLKSKKMSYQQVESLFGINIAKFGRGINVTENAVVLISSIQKENHAFVYHDKWTENGDYIYSGEGKQGEQKLVRGNKAIINAEKDGKGLYLFVKSSPEDYYYQGKVVLVEYTLEEEKDEGGNTRKEYKFRLRRCAENE